MSRSACRTETRKALTDAEAALSDTPPSHDCLAVARSAGAEYVWWPADKYVDPRIRRWRGQAVTSNELDGLGVHELARLIGVGGIIEVG